MTSLVEDTPVEDTPMDTDSDSDAPDTIVAPPKKKRVLSEERKAALREQLAKVRAKRFEQYEPVRQLKKKVDKLKKVTERERLEGAARALAKLERLKVDDDEPEDIDKSLGSSPPPAEPEPRLETEYERRCRMARSLIFPNHY